MSDDLMRRLMMRLQEIYDRPHDFSNGQKSEAAGLARDRIEELEAKLDMVVETLEFYGDERNYESEYIPDECGCCGSWYEPKIHKDGQDSGDKARTTLAELTSSEAADNEVKGCNDE